MTHFLTNERSSHTGSEYPGKMLSLLMGNSMVPYWRWGTDPVVAAISRCMSKGQDRKGLSTAGQLLIEPRGPVSVCARTCSPLIIAWWTMTGRWIVTMMSSGFQLAGDLFFFFFLHIRIFKSRRPCLYWHIGEGRAKSIYQANRRYS